MIHSFSASNFYSIGDRVEISLISKRSKVESPELYSDAPLAQKISKIAFIGGKNSSGKTNVLRIPAFLRYMLVDSFGGSPNNREIPIKAFIPTADEPSSLETRFSIDEDSIFTYHITLNADKITEESLERESFINKRAAKHCVFKRELAGLNSNKYKISFSDELGFLNKVVTLEQLLNGNKRTSFIALINNFDDGGIISNITKCWQNVLSNTTQFGSMETEIPMTQLSTNTLMEIYEDSQLKDAVSAILTRYDIGFSEIAKQKNAGINGDETVYGLIHNYRYSPAFGMTMSSESSGTKRLIILLAYIMRVLSTGGVAVIDEMDAFLHPVIFEDMVEKFMSTTTNKNNAQLVFSAHSYGILSALDKQQITFTDRNDKGETVAWRLDDVQGVRVDDNYYTNYIAGKYDAIPRIGSI